MKFGAVGLRYSTADRCGFAETGGVRAMGHFSRGGSRWERCALGVRLAIPAKLANERVLVRQRVCLGC